MNAVLRAREPSSASHAAGPWTRAGNTLTIADPVRVGGPWGAAAEVEIKGDDRDLTAYEHDWEWILNVADDVGIGDQFGYNQTNVYEEQQANALPALFAGMAARFAGDMSATYVLYNIKLILHNINLILNYIKLIGLTLTQN